MENLIIIFSLIIIEGLLSIDNALVLAVLVRVLPDKKLQKRALTYGIWGAFIFRFIGLVIAKHLIKFTFFQLLGGLYLIYISIKHFAEHTIRKNKHRNKDTKTTAMDFWKVVFVVELTDIAFSIDSIIAAVALSRELWVIYTGAVLGIITMRMVAGVFVQIIDRFPTFYHTGYVLVCWVGVKLLSEYFNHILHIPMLPKWLFWGVMVVIFVLSFIIKIQPPQACREEIQEAGHDFTEINK